MEEKGNFIENRHTGIKTMQREMKKYGLSSPEFVIGRGYFKVIFRNTLLKDFDSVDVNKINNSTFYCEHQKTDLQRRVLDYCITLKSLKEIREYLKINLRSYLSKTIINSLIESGKLRYTYPQNIRSKNQKYVTVKEVK